MQKGDKMLSHKLHCSISLSQTVTFKFAYLLIHSFIEVEVFIVFSDERGGQEEPMLEETRTLDLCT